MVALLTNSLAQTDIQTVVSSFYQILNDIKQAVFICINAKPGWEHIGKQKAI